MEIEIFEMTEQKEETQPAHPEWSAPTVTRIELKRTLFGSGPLNDADGFTPASG